MKKILEWLIIGTLVLNLVACGGSNEKVSCKDIIEKLQTFTTMKEGDGKYTFNYNDEWILTYNEINEFANIKDAQIESCFKDYLGEDCLYEGSASDGGFIYDLDENAVRIYFDTEIYEGNLYFINYNISKEELTVRVGNDDYYASDEMINWMKEYGFFDIMEKDIQAFKGKLEENGLSIDALRIKYADIVKCLE